MRPSFCGQALSYPGGMPGFDPAHPASYRCSFSAVAVGANFINLHSGLQRGTATTLPTAAINGVIGPAPQFSSAGNALRFSGSWNITPSAVTLAAIFQLSAASVANGVFGTAQSNTTGCYLEINAANHPALIVAASSSSTFTTITLSSGVPYFVAVSGNAAVQNCVCINLLNGEIQSASKSIALTFTASGPAPAIGLVLDATGLSGQVAAVCSGFNLLSLAQLIQWAQRPWDFWYPPAIDELLFSGLKGPSLTSLIIDCGGGVEWLANANAGAAPPVENLLALRSDIFIPSEVTTGVRSDGATNAESVVSVDADAAPAVENVLSLRGDIVTPREATAGVCNDGAANAESAASVAVDAAPAAENLAPLRADATPAIEINVALLVDRPAVTEFLSSASADSAVTTESMATLFAVMSDSSLVLEWTTGSISDAAAALEAVAAALRGVTFVGAAAAAVFIGTASAGTFVGAAASARFTTRTGAIEATLRQGDTFPIFGLLTYSDGSPFNLCAGAAATWTLNDCDGNARLSYQLGAGVVVTDPVNGKITITIPAGDSAGLAPGTYTGTLRAVDPNGFVSLQWTGTIKVRP